jgi:hypothetical protein
MCLNGTWMCLGMCLIRGDFGCRRSPRQLGTHSARWLTPAELGVRSTGRAPGPLHERRSFRRMGDRALLAYKRGSQVHSTTLSGRRNESHGRGLQRGYGAAAIRIGRHRHSCAQAPGSEAWRRDEKRIGPRDHLSGGPAAAGHRSIRRAGHRDRRRSSECCLRPFQRRSPVPLGHREDNAEIRRWARTRADRAVSCGSVPGTQPDERDQREPGRRYLREHAPSEATGSLKTPG